MNIQLLRAGESDIEPARRLYRGWGFEAREKYLLMTLELVE